jgi:coenzyme Q-binding protein COQ10
MPKITQEYVSDYSVNQLFDLILDIEEYPQFLPWCKGAEIISKNDNEIIVDLIISYKAFTEQYRSQVTFEQFDNNASIRATAIDGPFKYLSNVWKFEKYGEKTKIYFYLDFALKSGLLNKFIGLFFAKACEKMFKAFQARAGQLYKRDK